HYCIGRRTRSGRPASRPLLLRPALDRHRDRQTERSLMLAVHDLVVDIEGSRVLRGISFEVRDGEFVCLVGRNGAGKTTAFRSIMGFRKPVSGSIGFKDHSLLGLRPFEIARLGVGFAPEEGEVFGELTVAENVALPTWTCPNERAASERIDEAYKVFPNLRRYMQRD